MISFDLNHQGRYREMVKSLERSLLLRERVYGPTHVEVLSLCERLTSLCNTYGMLYLQQCMRLLFAVLICSQF